MNFNNQTFYYLQFELSSSIGVLTIDHARDLNALNSLVLRELRSFIQDLSEREDLSVLLITGAGRSFVAGADIKEMINFNKEEAKIFSEEGQKVFSLIESLHFPVIALVNGFALGGGWELALACDIIIMSDKAKVGLPEVNLGLFPAFGGTRRLTKAVGAHKAKEIIFSGKVYSAQEAFEMGLGNKVVAHSELMQTGLSLAENIKNKSALGIEQAKKLIQEEDDPVSQKRSVKEAEEFGNLFDVPATKERMRSFLEKRKTNT